MLSHNPLLLVDFCFFATCKSYTLLRILDTSVISRTQLLWITDSKQPFRDPFQNTFVKKGKFWVLPSACKGEVLGITLRLLKPPPNICVLFSGFFFRRNKKGYFAKADRLHEYALFPQKTNRFCNSANKSKRLNCIIHFSHNKKQKFLFFVVAFLSCILSFMFVFLQHRQGKKKKQMPFSFRKPSF